MNKIASIHQKILDNFIRRMEDDVAFYFAPRKINNKNRLTEGYWFLGNEDYINLSFWNGTDWKQKINNIGFVIWENKKYAIELVAQDTTNKKPLMEAIVKAIPGFSKDPNKNRWYKHYEGTDYMAGLNNFLENDKPIIDKLVERYKGNGIIALDKAYAKRYIEKIIRLRKEQITFGLTNKITRITWNTLRWQRPSGPAGKSSSREAYEAGSGYGHEEWLLDKQRIIGGYHYGFIQSLNIQTDRHIDNRYNISLFTNDNHGSSYLVGEIKEAECIDEALSNEIYKTYHRNGWLTEMENDIIAVGANIEKFRETTSNIFFNVRFKFENTIILDEPEKIDINDVNITTNHFKLLPKRTVGLKKQTIILTDLGGNNYDKRKNTAPRIKTYDVSCEYDPYHDRIQNELFDLLKSGFEGYTVVKMEESYVDIRAKQGEEWHFFEIKTDSPRICIRKALGQIMEYAFFPDYEHAKKLIIIGDSNPDENVQIYLKKIREDYEIPVVYRSFNMLDKTLSREY